MKSGRFALLTRLDVRSGNLPSPPTTVASFEGKVGLVASLLDAAPAMAGHAITFQLVWLDLQQTGEDFMVFVHLRDSSNRTVAQADGQPIAGSFPTSQWRSGDVVYDRRSLDLPANVVPG